MQRFNVAEMANELEVQAVYVGSRLTGVFIGGEFHQATATGIHEITVTTIGDPGHLIVLLVENSQGIVYKHPNLSITEKYHSS